MKQISYYRVYLRCYGNLNSQYLGQVETYEEARKLKVKRTLQPKEYYSITKYINGVAVKSMKLS